jgi:homoserine O-acetyltransferase
MTLPKITVAYETYGVLNHDKSNAILLLHALSGSSHAAGKYQDSESEGWWDNMVGPGKPFDTNKYFMICSNILGSCYGTTGPSSLDPSTNKAYGLDFPVITVQDMVNVQKKLIDYLGIKKLYSVAGGSLGGMQALKWALLYPEMVHSSIVIAATSKMSSQNIAFNEIGRISILSDPYFNNGTYYENEKKPEMGLALARMIAHITYLSEESMDNKFGRDLMSGNYMFNLKEAEFEVQSYLHYQGYKFVRRFDANSYLYITKAMDYFDVTSHLENFKSDTRFLIIAFTSDWLFPPTQSLVIVDALRKNKNPVSYAKIQAKEGHDAFLLNINEQSQIISSFLKGIAYV